MMGLDENQVIVVYLTVGTLKKVFDILTPEEQKLVFFANLKPTKKKIANEIAKKEEKAERDYEKQKAQILHKRETRRKQAAERRKKPPQRKSGDLQ